jgi:hypothetical protein
LNPKLKIETEEVKYSGLMEATVSAKASR